MTVDSLDSGFRHLRPPGTCDGRAAAGTPVRALRRVGIGEIVSAAAAHGPIVHRLGGESRYHRPLPRNPLNIRRYAP
jgi:hypothetical protein